MSKTTNAYPDFTKMFAEFKTPAFDYNALFSLQRRNIEAFTAANQALTDGVRVLSRRQAEIMQNSIDEALNGVRDVMSATTPEANASKQTETVRKLVENTVTNARELAEMASKSNTEAFDVLNKRFVESLDEWTKLASNAAPKAA